MSSASLPRPGLVTRIFWPGFSTASRSQTSSPVRPRPRALARAELQGKNAHADEIRAMDPLVAFRDHGADAEEDRALGRPVARACPSRTPFPRSPAGGPSRGVFLRRLVDGKLLARWEVACESAFHPRTSLLRMRMLANVPRIITSWLPRRDPYVLKSSFLARRAPPAIARWLFRGCSRRGDVIGRHGIPEHGEDARAGTRGIAAGRAEIPSKNDGLPYVRGLAVPAVAPVLRGAHVLPGIVSGEHARIHGSKHFRREVLQECGIDLGQGRPDVFQMRSGSRSCHGR